MPIVHGFLCVLVSHTSGPSRLDFRRTDGGRRVLCPCLQAGRALGIIGSKAVALGLSELAVRIVSLLIPMGECTPYSSRPLRSPPAPLPPCSPCSRSSSPLLLLPPLRPMAFTVYSMLLMVPWCAVNEEDKGAVLASRHSNLDFVPSNAARACASAPTYMPCRLLLREPFHLRATQLCGCGGGCCSCRSIFSSHAFRVCCNSRITPMMYGHQWWWWPDEPPRLQWGCSTCVRPRTARQRCSPPTAGPSQGGASAACYNPVFQWQRC